MYVAKLSPSGDSQYNEEFKFYPAVIRETSNYPRSFYFRSGTAILAGDAVTVRRFELIWWGWGLNLQSVSFIVHVHQRFHQVCPYLKLSIDLFQKFNIISQ